MVCGSWSQVCRLDRPVIVMLGWFFAGDRQEIGISWFSAEDKMLRCPVIRLGGFGAFPKAEEKESIHADDSEGQEHQCY